MSVTDETRRYWDADSAVYDDVPGHHPTSAAEQAAWTAALVGLLPPPPCRVLDCGAGTGFLSIAAARLGHRVTAVDLSPEMLKRLSAKAEASGLEIEVVEGPAEQPPSGGFDAVMERHLMWALPDPGATLRAWREVAPSGRLVLFEGIWGTIDPIERLRRAAQGLLARAVSAGKGTARRSGHHAEYPPELREAMPLGSGTTPDALATLVRDAGWPAPRLQRLRDVEWASALSLPLPQRLLGAAPRFAVLAGA
jgi:SAM-dependent methyltransferase